MGQSNTLRKKLLLTSALLLTASVGCVPLKEEAAKVKSATSSIEFSSFCSQAALSNCHIKPLKNIENSAWDAGVDTFNEVLRSSSFITFTRESFSQDSVKSLVNTLGGQGVVAFIDRIPWESLHISQSKGGIQLVNENYTAKATFNGLTIISKRRAIISPAEGRTFNVSGVQLQTKLGIEEVSKLSLEDPGVMHITTNFGTIKNIPVNFFYLEDQMMATRTDFTPGDLIEAVSDVVLDHNIAYNNDFYIDLNKGNISNISAPIMGNIKEGLGKDIAKLLLDKARIARVNMSHGADLISLFNESHTRCEFKLGGHNSAIGIQKGVSLSSPVRKGSGVKLAVKGIDVSVQFGPFPINGSVTEVYLGPEKVVIKVLGREFELKYDDPAAKDMKGPEGITCK